MKKKWLIKPTSEKESIEKLSNEINVNHIVSNLLIQRGINNFENAKSYFRPSLKDLHNPFLMKNMTKAVNRLHQAVSNNEYIMIYGDYDVDGTTSVALMYLFLKSFYKNIHYYVPDRYNEGYGISQQGVDFAIKNNCTLFIALDCGIKAIDLVNYGNENNLDFIICDHHLPGNTLPEAHALLDPKQPDCTYPFKELSGCGVGFKLAQAYTLQYNLPQEKYIELLDLVAISIAADIVPIVDENRVLAAFGLKQLNAKPRIGIQAILNISNFKQKITISDIVFTIGPKINAAGRMTHALKSVELLICNNEITAKDIAQEINIDNNNRKKIDTETTNEALSMIETEEKEQGKYLSTVLYNSNWHKGVIGIVASRLISHYYRPTVLFTQTNGSYTGSARSVKGFDLYDAIQKCEHYLEQYGGHKYAAGLKVKPENIETFKKVFNNIVSELTQGKEFIPEIEIDAKIEFSTINDKFYNLIRQFAPFGPENMKPVFATHNVADTGYAKAVGENKDHLKLTVYQPSGNSQIAFPAIGFGFGNYINDIRTNNTFSIAYTIDENIWQGYRSLQLIIKDIVFDK